MSIRITLTIARTLLVSAIALLGAGPTFSDPTNGPARVEVGLRAWLGCWEQEVDPAGLGPLSPGPAICIAAGDAPRVLVLSVKADGEVVATDSLAVDGQRHPVIQGGCSGWRRSGESADARRLYLQAETTCVGSGTSSLSGVSLFLSSGHWVDITVTRVEEERELVIRRYRLVQASGALDEVDGDRVTAPLVFGAIPSAGHTTRVSAAASLDANAVIEAVEWVDPAVVEAMLVEVGAGFPIDSDLLIRLDDAGVPGRVIDLMTALTFSDAFTIQDDTVARRRVASQTYGSPWFYDRFYPYGPYGPYGYWYDHGDWHEDYPGSGDNDGGRLINGLGYTRVQPKRPFLEGLPQVGAGGAEGGGGGGGSVGSGGSPASSSGSAGSSGYEGGSSGSGRRAVPR